MYRQNGEVKPASIPTIGNVSLLSANSPHLMFCKLYHNYRMRTTPIYACLDTGSTTTFIQKSAAKALGGHIDENFRPPFKVANNETSHSVGTSTIHVRFRPSQSNCVSIKCIVTKDGQLPYQCLLGLDFLNQGTLDLAKSKLYHPSIPYDIKLESKIALESSNLNKIPKGDNEKDKSNPFSIIPSSKFVPISSFKEQSNFATIPKIQDCSLAIAEEPPKTNSLKVDINPDLPDPIRSKYHDLIEEYKDLFIIDMKNIGKYKGPEEYQVEITTERPINAGTYDIPFHLQDDFRKHISQLKEHGLIEESENTKYSHGFLAVPKKDGSTRWASDMRKLNAVTVEDAYVLPKLSTLLAHMNGKEVFAQMDIFACFHQFGIAEESRDYFGFIDPLTGIRYRWTRCFFGLRNIPQYISYLMSNRVFRNKDLSESSVYIDDITCYNDDHFSLLKNLRDVFARVRKFGLKFKAPKCHFGYTKISQFGYEISAKGIRADPQRVEKLRCLKPPTDKKQLHTSIGALGYFRDVIPEFARYSSILTPLLSEDAEYIWSEKHDQAWKGLLEAVKNSITLTRPDPNAQMIVTSDASNLYHGGMLTQEIDGENRIIAVHSAHIPKASHSWAINVKEMLGVVKLCERFEKFLIGHKFLLRVDNSSVYHILRNPQSVWYSKPGPVVRLLTRLANFSFEVEHNKGVADNFKLADLLSRRNDVTCEIDHRTTVADLLKPHFGDDESEEDEPTEHRCNAISLPEITSRAELIRITKQEQRAVEEDLLRKYQNSNDLTTNDGIRVGGKLVVPPHAIPIILEKAHRHHGIQRELAMIRNCGIRWRGMTKDVENFVKSCPRCSRLRKPQPTQDIGIFPRAPMSTFESVAIDHLVVGQGNRAIYVLALLDHLSGYIIMEQVPSANSIDTLHTLMRWILMYNIQECSLRADNAFNTREIKEQMNIANIHVRFGIPRNSRSNAEIERRFRMVNERYRVYDLAEDMDNLNVPLTLAFVQAELNATPLNTTAVTPFEIVFGKTPKAFLGEPLDNLVVNDLQSFASAQYERMKILSSFITAHHDRHAEERNVSTPENMMKVGDKVRFLVSQPPGSNKLRHLPLSEEIGTIKEVRRSTRSYVVEVNYPNRQPVQSLRHHRQLKKVVEREDHLQVNDEVAEPQPPNEPDPEIEDIVNSPQINVHNDNNDNDTENFVTNRDQPNIRSGRVSRRPAYLADYEE